jgi:hypothetical protein
MSKIRNLQTKSDPVEDDDCIEDLVNLLIELTPHALTLEVINDRPAYSKLRDGLREADFILSGLRKKLRWEILPEIDQDYKKRVPKYKGNTDHFKTSK